MTGGRFPRPDFLDQVHALVGVIAGVEPGRQTLTQFQPFKPLIAFKACAAFEIFLSSLSPFPRIEESIAGFILPRYSKMAVPPSENH